MAHKFIFDGKTIKGLNRLVLEVVKKYVSEKVSMNYKELKLRFPDSLQGSLGVFKTKEEIKSMNLKDEERRFFMDDKDIISLLDTHIYVSRGWGDDWIDNKSGQQKEGNKKRFLEFVHNNLDYNVIEENETFPISLDRDGFREYLIKIGFALNGINTYLGYINQQKIAILNKIEKYKNLSDVEKILTFAKEDSNFKDEFDKYHNYSKNYTFTDILSGARRYELYLQYKAVLDSMNKFKNDNTQYKTDNLYMYFKVFNETTLYPIKSICRENLNILGLDEYFTTDQAKGKLNNIFNFKNNNSNIIFIDNRENLMKTKNIILYGAPGVGKTHNTNKLISLIDKGKSEKEIFSALKENKNETITLNDDLKSRVKFITFHQSFGYEDFIEGFRPNNEGDIKIEKGIFYNICKSAEENRDKNYYLVIDEINRGNISKIFGELITLIEEDKRDKIEVALPYSKETFKVPSNLFIIGTMNSTDKSIALIDIALRRRFTFLKMSPNETLVPQIAKRIFNDLNKKISETIGEDYKIGHSYFMNISNEDDLNFVLEYKITPLLEEYFYGNKEQLDEVLEIIKG